MSKCLLVAALLLAFAIQVFGRGADHRTDHPVTLDKAPAGLNELINHTNRVHGFFVNAEDRFFFAGDTSVFVTFLKQYAALRGIAGHRLIIHPGKGVAKSPWDDGEGKPCDWMLDVAPVSWREGHADKVHRDKNGARPKEGEQEYFVEVHVWSDGNVDLSTLTVPKGLHTERHSEKSEDKEAPNQSIQAAK